MDDVAFNGIDCETGNPLVPALDLQVVAALARGSAPDAAERQFMEGRLAVTRAIKLGVDENEPADAGWAVVFHESESPTVRSALQDLVDHRRARAADHRPGVPRHRVLV
jgi:hypothetical protein